MDNKEKEIYRRLMRLNAFENVALGLMELLADERWVIKGPAGMYILRAHKNVMEALTELKGAIKKLND